MIGVCLGAKDDVGEEGPFYDSLGKLIEARKGRPIGGVRGDEF